MVPGDSGFSEDLRVTMIRKVHLSAITLQLLLFSVTYTFGQTASSPAQTRPVRRPNAPVAEARSTAPQVVTVVHRLNGLKMVRLLLRYQQQVEALTHFDDAFKLMDDVHTNVIAGLALEDGETVAAWLPEAEVEFPRIDLLTPPKDPFGTTAFGFTNNFVESPDLTVIDSHGKKMAAKFIGLDGATGLSILKITGKTAAQAPVLADVPISVGADVRLLGPEPVGRLRRSGPGSLYVRMGEATGTVSNVMQAPTGEVARFKVRSPRLLSTVNVGGIAISSNGETVGIVHSVEGVEASVLPAALIERAAKRVLESKRSVPKPWLGVRGEAVAALNAEQMQKLGWEMSNASKLAQQHRGILLTWIAPNSPAALAALRAGDVILKVNDEEVQSQADFTWFINQAGPTMNVAFTVARPNRLAEEEVNVRLSAFPGNLFARNAVAQTRSPRERWLAAQGIETIGLRPAVATRLGAKFGLLIVFVGPSTPASQAGLQPGDVIQTINGRPAMLANDSLLPAADGSDSLTFEIIRKKQKLTVALPKK